MEEEKKTQSTGAAATPQSVAKSTQSTGAAATPPLVAPNPSAQHVERSSNAVSSVEPESVLTDPPIAPTPIETDDEDRQTIPHAEKKRFRLLSLNITAKIALAFGLSYLAVSILCVLITFLVSNGSVVEAGKDLAEKYMDEVSQQFRVDGEAAEVNGYDELLKSHGITMRVEWQSRVWTNTEDSEAFYHHENWFGWSHEGNTYYCSRYRESEDGLTRGKFYVAIDLTSKLALVRPTQWAICVAIIVGLFIVVLIGGIVSDVVLRPIKKITEATRRITATSLSTRLAVTDTQDELRDLAEVINNLLNNLEDTVDSQERFVSDASHEIRTPISVIKGYSSLLQRWGSKDPEILTEGIDSIAKEADNMKLLVDDLLFLSRTSREVKSIQYQNFLLDELTDELYKEAQLVDAEHIIHKGSMEVMPIVASRDMIKQLLRIILDNAQKYTPKGGLITIECFMQNGDACVAITDSGIGIAPNDLPHVFDRFYRADKARKRVGGGSGLGMAIAKKIADSHHGEIVIESKRTEGTRVTVILPPDASQLPVA